MPNLTRRQLSILLGVAAYVLLSVVIGILLRSRLSASGRISSILSEVGGSWHQELILSQSIFEAQRAGRVVTVGDDLPKSFLLCRDGAGETTVYLSQLSSATLLKRMESGGFTV